MSKRQPLKSKIKDGVLTISIGIETLAFSAVSNSENEHQDESSGEYCPEYLVSNPLGFAREVLDELNKEEEDGTTPIHSLFDNAFYRLYENGSANVVYAEDSISARVACLSFDTQKFKTCLYKATK